MADPKRGITFGLLKTVVYETRKPLEFNLLFLFPLIQLNVERWCEIQKVSALISQKLNSRKVRFLTLPRSLDDVPLARRINLCSEV